ncbi:MAG: LytR/AlgR family response regulator transcription factor [Salibacteraceae bacterium]
MDRINILILEDQPLHAAKLELLLEEMEYGVLPPVDNVAEAIRVFHAASPDLLILDVMVHGEADGIDFANQLRNSDGSHVPIIFLTSMNDNHTFDRAKETSPYAYLLKPVDRFSLQHAIELALMKTYAKREEQTTKALESALQSGHNLFIKANKKLHKVRVQDIQVIEVEGRYCQLYTQDKKLLVRASLSQLLKKLPAEQFLQTHRNYLVNAEAIIDIELEDSVVNTAVKEVPISKNYRSLILKNLDFLK